MKKGNVTRKPPPSLQPSKRHTQPASKNEPPPLLVRGSGTGTAPAKQARPREIKKTQKLTPTQARKDNPQTIQNVPSGRPVVTFAAKEILQRGLLCVGVDLARQAMAKESTNVNRFKTMYGSDPAVYAKIWIDLQSTAIDEARIDGNKDSIVGFFIAINYLKRYRPEKEQAVTFKCSPTTIRKWRKYFVPRIAKLKKQKVVWPSAWEEPDATVPTLLFSVDGVHFRIEEPQHERYSKNTSFYSHKFKTSALNYEIAIDLATSRIVHTRGPYRAAIHDITVFREELMNKIPDGHFCIGDKGYIGELQKVMGPNSHDTPEVRQFKGRARARHESCNKRIKMFEIMDACFRHGIDEHEECFDAVVVICQYQFELGSPLFDV